VCIESEKDCTSFISRSSPRGYKPVKGDESKNDVKEQSRVTSAYDSSSSGRVWLPEL
jgi:hypothetical protein